MLGSKKESKLFWWIVIAFTLVPLIVSVVSTIHVINFFQLSNTNALSLTLAIAFEIGALSALAGLIALDKINKNVVWFIFLILTLYQMMGNTYYAYDLISNRMITNPNLIKNWTELFGMTDSDSIFIKRMMAIISGAILPIVSLSFLDLLVSYIQKSRKKNEALPINEVHTPTVDEINEEYGIGNVIEPAVSDEVKNMAKPEVTNESVNESVNEGVNEEQGPTKKDVKYPWESIEDKPVEQSDTSIIEPTPEPKHDGISLGKGSRHNVTYVKE